MEGIHGSAIAFIKKKPQVVNAKFNVLNQVEFFVRAIISSYIFQFPFNAHKKTRKWGTSFREWWKKIRKRFKQD